jgi:hypothetical protein
MTIPDPYHQHPSNNSEHSSAYNLRRSYSLPNVYHPDYYPQQMLYDMDELAESFNLKNQADNNVTSRSPSPDQDLLPSLDNMGLASPALSLALPGHRRSRSHSISHNPDYPENLNDFLTYAGDGASHFDD